MGIPYAENRVRRAASADRHPLNQSVRRAPCAAHSQIENGMFCAVSIKLRSNVVPVQADARRFRVSPVARHARASGYQRAERGASFRGGTAAFLIVLACSRARSQQCTSSSVARDAFSALGCVGDRSFRSSGFACFRSSIPRYVLLYRRAGSRTLCAPAAFCGEMRSARAPPGTECVS